MAEPVTDRPTDRASFFERFVAAIVDAVIVGVAGFVLVVVFDVVGQLLNLIVGIAYYISLEGSPSGQTVGKRLLGIRVVDADRGGPIDHVRATGRYFARILSAIPCFLGYLWMLWDGEKQTWHDKLVRTVVVPVASAPVSRWPG